MNKARLTYRLEQGNLRPVDEAAVSPEQMKSQGGHSEEVIPLHADDYEIVPPSTSESAGMRRNRMPGDMNRVGKPGRMYPNEPLNQFTTDFGAWQSPFDEETDRLEKIIRESDTYRKHEAAAQTEETGEGDVFPDRSRGEESVRYRSDRPALQWGSSGAGARRQARSMEVQLEESRSRRDAGPEPAYGYDSNEGNESDPESGYVPYPPRREQEPAVRRGQPSTTRLLRHTAPSWMKIAVSVTGAVATGIIFGFFVLTMFIADAPTPPDGAAAPPPGQHGSEISDPVVSGPPDSALPGLAGESGSVAVQLPAYTFYLLQHGVFSQKAGAEAAVSELAARGLAGVVEESDRYFVYAGYAASRNDAVQMRGRMESAGLEAYSKETTVPAASRLIWSEGGSGQNVTDYILQGRKLAQMIGGLTLLHLEQERPTAFEGSTLSSVRTEHQRWTGLSGTLGAEAPEAVKPLLQQLNNAFHTAVVSLEEYNKNPSEAYLWQAQSAVMKALLSEKTMLAALSAS